MFGPAPAPLSNVWALQVRQVLCLLILYEKFTHGRSKKCAGRRYRCFTLTQLRQLAKWTSTLTVFFKRPFLFIWERFEISAITHDVNKKDTIETINVSISAANSRIRIGQARARTTRLADDDIKTKIDQHRHEQPLEPKQDPSHSSPRAFSSWMAKKAFRSGRSFLLQMSSETWTLPSDIGVKQRCRRRRRESDDAVDDDWFIHRKVSDGGNELGSVGSANVDVAAAARRGCDNDARVVQRHWNVAFENVCQTTPSDHKPSYEQAESAGLAQFKRLFEFTSDQFATLGVNFSDFDLLC